MVIPYGRFGTSYRPSLEGSVGLPEVVAKR